MKHRRYLTWSTLLILSTLSGCVGTGDGGSVPLVPIGGGGGGSYSAPSPSRPILAPSSLAIESDPDVLYSEYEKHGASHPDDCDRMALRFQKEGRRVRFIRAVKNYNNKGGGLLEYICLFDGEDADNETSVFEDRRYNSADEYTYP